jgi:cyclase
MPDDTKQSLWVGVKTMNKIWLSLTTVLLATVLVVPTLHAQQRQSQQISFVKIADGIYEIRGGSGANGGCIIGDKEVIMIDAKMDEASVLEVLSKVKELTPNPIRYVINTHADGDHVNGNRYYPANAVYISHENCRAEMFLPSQNGAASIWNDPGLASYIPSVTYRDRMTIHLGNKVVQLWYFGTGHTTGDTVVYFPDAKVAFIGDQFFEGRPQLIHAYKGGSSFGHVETLTRMLNTLDAELFCNGHGEPATRDKIVAHIAAMKARQEKVKILMAKNTSIDDIKKEFPQNDAQLVETIYKELSK